MIIIQDDRIWICKCGFDVNEGNWCQNCTRHREVCENEKRQSKPTEKGAK